MKHFKAFDSKAEFDEYQNSLNKPSVSYIRQEKLVKYDLYEYLIPMMEFELINYNVPNRNFIQLDDIDITDGLKEEYKTTFGVLRGNKRQMLYYEKTSFFKGSAQLLFQSYQNSQIDKYFKWFGDKLKLYDRNEKLISIFTFNGLKRKDNGKYDFVGQIDSFMDSKNKPHVTISSNNRTNELEQLQTPTENNMTFTYKGQTIDYNLYELPKTTMLMAYKL